MIGSFIQKSITEHVFLKDFFDVDHFLKSLLNLLQHCFFFIFFNRWLIFHERYEILAPQPGIEPALLELEGKILTIGPLGKSVWSTFYVLATVLGSEGTASGRQILPCSQGTNMLVGKQIMNIHILKAL